MALFRNRDVGCKFNIEITRGMLRKPETKHEGLNNPGLVLKLVIWLRIGTLKLPDL